MVFALYPSIPRGIGLTYVGCLGLKESSAAFKSWFGNQVVNKQEKRDMSMQKSKTFFE